MMKIMGVLGSLALTLSAVLMAEDLPRAAKPADAGVSAGALADLIANIGGFDEGRYGYAHSFMVIRNGKVAAEGWRRPFTPDKKHAMFSASKSFTSTAIGIAADAGLLKLDDPVVKFFPEHASGKISARMRTVTVRHLLMMASGHRQCPFTQFCMQQGMVAEAAKLFGKIPVRKPLETLVPAGFPKFFLECEPQGEPGTFFMYNNGATFMLSAIVQKVAGKPLDKFLEEKLFTPMGIKDFFWEKSQDGICLGCTGLYLRTEDLAKFGVLLAKKGEWNGQRLISADYLKAATRKQIKVSDGMQYGYQFWIDPNGNFRVAGHMGQGVCVVPDKGLAIAYTAAADEMRFCAPMSFAAEKLCLEENPEKPGDAERLAARLAEAAKWTLPLPAGSEKLPDEAPGRYRLGKNAQNWETLEITYTDNGLRLEFFPKKGLPPDMGALIIAGTRAFADGGGMYIGPIFSRQTVAAAARADGGAIALSLCTDGNIFLTSMRLRFDGDQVTITHTVPEYYGLMMDKSWEFTGKKEK